MYFPVITQCTDMIHLMIYAPQMVKPVRIFYEKVYVKALSLEAKYCFQQKATSGIHFVFTYTP